MQLNKFLALARSCPVSIGWVPKKSEIGKAALRASVESTTQGSTLSLQSAGFTSKLTANESCSLSQVAQKFSSTLALSGEAPSSTARKRRNRAAAAPFKTSFKVDHINFLIFSPYQPSVLSTQATLLGLEGQMVVLAELQSVTASVGSLLITDKRALAADYHAIVSMLPEGGKCLQVNYASHGDAPARTADTTSFTRQGAIASHFIMMIMNSVISTYLCACVCVSVCLCM
jgi:hypothetical protein